MSPKALENRRLRMIEKLNNGDLRPNYEKIKIKKQDPELYEDWRQYKL